MLDITVTPGGKILDYSNLSLPTIARSKRKPNLSFYDNRGAGRPHKLHGQLSKQEKQAYGFYRL
jgi:hypothetical protein